MDHLAASRERLLQAVDGLSAEQRTFQPAEDRWSVAGCVEHIILVEDFVFQTMQQVLQTPPNQPRNKPRFATRTRLLSNEFRRAPRA